MNWKLVVTAIIALSFVWVFFNFTISEDPYVSRILNLTYDMDSKFEISPGQVLVINGKLFNSGYLWLYDVNLSVENLPAGFTATIEPSYTSVFKREFVFNGSPRGSPKPLDFTVTINVPQSLLSQEYDFNISASGVFKRYIPSDEKYVVLGSVTRSQRIVLKSVPQPRFEVTDVTAPKEVVIGKPFNLSMIVTNNGNIAESANISVVIPADWTVDEKTQTVSLDEDESSTVVFTITPTNTSGNISIYWSYPYNQTVLNFTQVGPSIAPVNASTMPQIKLPFELTTTNLIVIAAIIIVIALVAYTLSNYKIRISRGKPEEVKKQVPESKGSLSDLLC